MVSVPFKPTAGATEELSQPPRQAGSVSVVLDQVLQFWIIDYMSVMTAT